MLHGGPLGTRVPEPTLAWGASQRPPRASPASLVEEAPVAHMQGPFRPVLLQHQRPTQVWSQNLPECHPHMIAFIHRESFTKYRKALYTPCTAGMGQGAANAEATHRHAGEARQTLPATNASERSAADQLARLQEPQAKPAAEVEAHSKLPGATAEQHDSSSRHEPVDSNTSALGSMSALAREGIDLSADPQSSATGLAQLTAGISQFKATQPGQATCRGVETDNVREHALSEVSAESAASQEHGHAGQPEHSAAAGRPSTVARSDELRSSGGSVGSRRSGYDIPSVSQQGSSPSSGCERPEIANR